MILYIKSGFYYRDTDGYYDITQSHWIWEIDKADMWADAWDIRGFFYVGY